MPKYSPNIPKYEACNCEQALRLITRLEASNQALSLSKSSLEIAVSMLDASPMLKQKYQTVINRLSTEIQLTKEIVDSYAD